MTQSRFKSLTRKLVFLFFATVDIAFLIVVVVGIWQLLKTY